LDPRYSENTPFMTNEYDVQNESGVLNMLMATPAYFKTVPNP